MPGFTIKSGKKVRDGGLPPHVHDEAQLTFAVSGSVQIHTNEGRWLVPRQLAVFIPAGVLHRAEILTDAELWVMHWEMWALRAWAPSNLPDRAFALHVSPLLRSLLDAAFAEGAAPDRLELVARLMLHELTEVTHAPTFLPFPTSPIGRRVADITFQDPRNQLAVGELASRSATSARTLSRVFPLETGLTFKAWRQRARIVNTMNWLANGRTIAAVSASAGYASTAAFSAAFRKVTGMTPTAFLEGPVASRKPGNGRPAPS